MTLINFIDLVRDYPIIGFLIALVFFALMFGMKNLILYLYSRHIEQQDYLKHHPNSGVPHLH